MKKQDRKKDLIQFFIRANSSQDSRDFNLDKFADEYLERNNEKEDVLKNPLAFPDPMRGAEANFINQTPHELDSGMTLRDYFAAKAMQAQLGFSGGLFVSEGHFGTYAEYSYKMADAMLNHREL